MSIGDGLYWLGVYLAVGFLLFTMDTMALGFALLAIAWVFYGFSPITYAYYVRMRVEAKRIERDL